MTSLSARNEKTAQQEEGDRAPKVAPGRSWPVPVSQAGGRLTARAGGEKEPQPAGEGQS